MTDLLDSCHASLKICGVTRQADAEALIDLGVHALGVNFWPGSKRYVAPEAALPMLNHCTGKILRVGVFVNADPGLPKNLLESDYIDLAQFHGDETEAYCRVFADAGLPFIKAIGVKNKASLENIGRYRANAVLLDTPAPGVYGGTGETFDWSHAQEFVSTHPGTPVLLAGGITPDNAAEAVARVRPCALDVASGAESSPGVKDMDKVAALLSALTPAPRTP